MEERRFRISPFDHGFLYGLGFFETFRTYKGKRIFTTAFNRLSEALKNTALHFPYTLNDLEEVIETVKCTRRQ